MFIHFFCLCPLSLAIKLNFNISKVVYWNEIFFLAIYQTCLYITCYHCFYFLKDIHRFPDFPFPSVLTSLELNISVHCDGLTQMTQTQVLWLDWHLSKPATSPLQNSPTKRNMLKVNSVLIYSLFSESKAGDGNCQWWIWLLWNGEDCEKILDRFAWDLPVKIKSKGH